MGDSEGGTKTRRGGVNRYDISLNSGRDMTPEKGDDVIKDLSLTEVEDGGRDRKEIAPSPLLSPGRTPISPSGPVPPTVRLRPLGLPGHPRSLSCHTSPFRLFPPTSVRPVESYRISSFTRQTRDRFV